MSEQNRNNPGGQSAYRSSKEFDFDRLLAGKPLAKRAADTAAVSAAVGDMIRRIRVQKGVSQAELAKRVACTQPHLSELERGLGSNGPTLSMLVRIIHELEDDLVIDTEKERRRRDAELKADARLSVNEFDALLNSGFRRGKNDAFRDWFNKVEENPYARILNEGILAGFYMALQWVPSHSQNEIRSALQMVENQDEMSQLVGHFSRG